MEPLEAQKEATAKLQANLISVIAKAQAEVSRKMESVVVLTRVEVICLHSLENKPQRVSLLPLAFSTLLWKAYVPCHDFLSPYSKKGGVMEGYLDSLVPMTYSRRTRLGGSFKRWRMTNRPMRATLSR